jgi:hypothetical protein
MLCRPITPLQFSVGSLVAPQKSNTGQKIARAARLILGAVASYGAIKYGKTV